MARILTATRRTIGDLPNDVVGDGLIDGEPVYLAFMCGVDRDVDSLPLVVAASSLASSLVPLPAQQKCVASAFLKLVLMLREIKWTSSMCGSFS